MRWRADPIFFVARNVISGTQTLKARPMRNRRGLGNDRRGAAAAEYALVLAIAGAAITFAALALGTAITSSIEEPVECAAATASVATEC